MKVIMTDENVLYEVQPCSHCHEDCVEYIPANEPWHDEHWQCTSCDSTFVIFNETIAKQRNENILHK